MRNLLSHIIFALSCPCTCARRAHTPSCTRSKIIAPVFLPSIDFSDLNLLVPSTSLPPAFVPGFWFFVSRESPLLWYNGSHLRPADATEQVRRQPRWRDQTCSLWSRISLSFFSPPTLSLFNTAPALEAQPFFFFKFPKLLVHMLPNECSHQMSHKHADFLAGFVAAASVTTF